MTTQAEIIHIALGLCQSAAEDASSAAAFGGSMHDPGDRLLALVAAYRAGMSGSVPSFLGGYMPEAERLGHANELIKVISQHGHRFFWNEVAQRVARLELDERGKVWWVDDYRATRVCTEKIGGYEHRWYGFSHGGTLKQLVQMMRDYVKTGEKIPAGYIGMECWGYDYEATKATIEAAVCMPIIKP